MTPPIPTPDSLVVVLARMEEKLDALLGRMDRHEAERVALDLRVRVLETDVAGIKATITSRADADRAAGDKAPRPVSWTAAMAAIASLAAAILTAILIYKR